MPGSPGTEPAPDLPPGPRLALVVATTTYNDTGLRRLRAPAQDATELARVLGDPAIGGFSVTSVIDHSAQAIRMAVEDFLADRGTQDLLLVYLSCHGLLDPHRRLFFAATDTRKDRLGSTGVEAAWVLDQLEHCRARRQILILDSCFSGAFAHGAKGAAELGLQDRFAGQGRGRVVLTASTATEYSFEGEPADPAATTGSVFTAALVAGLRTGAADTDHDGYISVDDAYAYTFDQVQAVGAPQTPQRWLYGAEGKIVMARSAAGRAVTPTPLPDSLRGGLESPLPGIRIGAVNELGTWLTSGDPARALAARHHLRQVADDDIPRVADTAQALLGADITATAIEAPVSSALDRRHTRVIKVPAPPETSATPPMQATVIPSRQVRTLRGRTMRRIYAVSFSPDGRLLASVGDDDGTVWLWDPATGQHLRTLQGALGAIGAVAFSPDGRMLATVGRIVEIWDPTTGQHLRTLEGWSTAVAFTPHGRLLACGFAVVVRVVDPATGQAESHPRLITSGNQDYIEARAFSPDGRLLATGHSSGKVQLWNVVTGQHERTLKHAHRHGHRKSGKAIEVVAFSPDGDLFASADMCDIRLWNPATGEHLRTLRTNAACGVDVVAFSPDGRVLATANAKVELWDPATGDHVSTLQSEDDTGDVRVGCIAFSPDGRLLAIGKYSEPDLSDGLEVTSEDSVASVQVWN